MRRAIWRGLARIAALACRSAAAPASSISRPSRSANGVFIGAQAYIQGRFDGTCVIGDNVWIGPQAYFDARDLVIEEYVGWGPGAKVLGSAHTGMPVDVPIVRTDLEIRPVRIGAWADIGTNATILPGVTVGKGAIVGAGAVVTQMWSPSPSSPACRRGSCAGAQTPNGRAADAKERNTAMKDKRILITGGAGLIGSHIADLVALEQPREIVILDNFVRGRRENLARSAARIRLTIVEGDIRDRALLAKALRRRRHRLPPGGDPHHPVRRRAAAGLRGAGRRHVQRARSRGQRGRVEGGRRLVGLGARPGRQLPDDRGAPSLQQPHDLRRRQGLQRRACCAASTRCTGCDYVALRYFNVYGPRMDVYGAYTEVLIRWMERIAAGQPPLIFGDGIADDGFRPCPRHRARQHPGREVRRHRRGLQRRQRHRNEPARACARRLTRIMGSSLEPQHAPARKVNAVPRRLADTQKGERTARASKPRFRSTRACATWSTGGAQERRGNGGGCRMTQAFHQIPVAKPVLDENEVEAARRVILSGWVTQGPEVAAFEREFAELVGAPHACAVSNCTTALHLALMAVGVGTGDEVITVSHSFIATANAIRYCGATPVFVDIEPEGFNIDPNLIERGDHAAHQGHPVRPSARDAVRPQRASSRSPSATRYRSSRTRPAPSAARSCGTGAGKRSAGRTATSPASPSIRARSSPPAMAAC